MPADVREQELRWRAGQSGPWARGREQDLGRGRPPGSPRGKAPAEQDSGLFLKVQR